MAGARPILAYRDDGRAYIDLEALDQLLERQEFTDRIYELEQDFSTTAHELEMRKIDLDAALNSIADLTEEVAQLKQKIAMYEKVDKAFKAYIHVVEKEK